MLAAMWHWQVSEFEGGRPLLEALRLRVPAAPQGFLHQLLRKGRILGDATPLAGNAVVGAGMTVTALPSERLAELIVSCGLPPQAILYEDPFALVVDKPAGLAMHRAAGHADNLVERVGVFMAWRHAGFQVAPVHRLDVGTSGAVLFGKGHRAIGQYGRLLMDGAIGKRYLALVRGQLPEQGELTTSVFENGVKRAALSRFRRLGAAAALALVELELVTGRQHQARRQLADAGWPIVGDRRYGGPCWPGLEHPALHCCELRFPSLADGEPRRVVSTLPERLRQLLDDANLSTAAAENHR
jgi:23S rRNA-/tRNA-specific pseudouridylate synthase